MDSTLSNGVPFKSIGEIGVVGVLFVDITMYLHLTLSLLVEEQLSISATSFPSTQ